MDPSTPENLERFLAAQTMARGFYLAPARMCCGADGAEDVEFGLDIKIMLRDLHVRQAWEIGAQDVDRVAISEEDEPVVPEGVKNAPVEEILRGRAERGGTRRRRR